MKTIKQIAEEIGVSKQAIHQKMKKEPLSTCLHQFTSTIDGIVHISVDGEMLIKSAFLKKECKPVDINEPSTNHQQENDLLTVLQTAILTLQGQLEVKDKQIEIKDKQIADLTETIKTQAQSISAANHNDLAETLQQQLLTDGREVEKTKRGIFGVLNRKKRNYGKQFK